MLIGPPITIKEGPKNVWIYNKKYQVSPIEWSYSANPNEKVFGTSQFFKGDCPYAKEKVLSNEPCDFYYVSDVVDFSENKLKLYVKGKGKFRIGVNSSKGYINQEVELSDNWQEVEFDLTRAIHITQHGDKLKTNLKISFTPLTNNFEIYISKFILK